jgi:hypothetical protein
MEAVGEAEWLGEAVGALEGVGAAEPEAAALPVPAGTAAAAAPPMLVPVMVTLAVVVSEGDWVGVVEAVPLCVPIPPCAG